MVQKYRVFVINNDPVDVSEDQYVNILKMFNAGAKFAYLASTGETIILSSISAIKPLLSPNYVYRPKELNVKLQASVSKLLNKPNDEL